MKLLDDYILRAESKSLILKENTAPYASNREFKDGTFRLLSSEKRAALELLNALEGTERKDEERIEIHTLRGALYRRRQNDLAFRHDFSPLSVAEHMSTWSENMPVREAAYVFGSTKRSFPTGISTKRPGAHCRSLVSTCCTTAPRTSLWKRFNTCSAGSSRTRKETAP